MITSIAPLVKINNRSKGGGYCAQRARMLFTINFYLVTTYLINRLMSPSHDDPISAVPITQTRQHSNHRALPQYLLLRLT